MNHPKNKGSELDQPERWDISIRTIDFERIIIFLSVFTKAFARRVLKQKKFIIIIEYDNKEKRTKIKFS